MAQNTLVKEQLTDAMIDAGELLLRELDRLGVPLTSAFWLFDIEVNEWRLVFASPEAAKVGSLAIYRQLQSAVTALGPRISAVPFSSIQVMNEDAEIVHLLGLAVKTGDDIQRIRFSRNAINGRYIDDTLIYRVAK